MSYVIIYNHTLNSLLHNYHVSLYQLSISRYIYYIYIVGTHTHFLSYWDKISRGKITRVHNIRNQNKEKQLCTLPNILGRIQESSKK